MRIVVSSLLVAAACSGTSSSKPDGAAAGSADAGETADSAATPDALSNSARQAAAATTATTDPLCTAIAPFYWEIGDAAGALGSGAEGSGSDVPDDTTVMSIASASKWLFGAYALEKLGGAPTGSDVALLNFTSGYIGFSSDNACSPTGTVDDCLAGSAGEQTASAIGMFDYNGAHLQELAHDLGDGAMGDNKLSAEVLSLIGTEITIQYSQPQPAGGVFTSAQQYAIFLRKLLVASPTPLKMSSFLTADSVCTNPATCPTALSSPIPKPGVDESWHYSLAHWIEDDATVGDGATSSAGSFGFYPWVDATQTYYGILARRTGTGGEGYDSAQCGRLIRKAWVTGVAITD